MRVSFVPRYVEALHDVIEITLVWVLNAVSDEALWSD